MKWKWSVLPSEEKEWGLPVAEPVQTPVVPPTTGPTPAKKDPSAPAGPSIVPGDYEVKKGDALAIISRKSGVSVSKLKLFNELTKDTIRIGQTLKIPTAAELASLATPVPAATPAPSPTPVPGKGKKSPEKAPVEPEIDTVAETTLIQVFLDRENFTIGPIDGNDGGAFRAMAGIYLGIHPDLQAAEALRAKAVEVVKEPYTTYKLQPADFRFISPPKATFISKPTGPPPGSHSPKGAAAKTLPAPSTAPARPSVTYEELLAPRFSAYRTPWEFVAERFHCDEAFLRRLNPNLKTVPTADTIFKVPNVTPFEIEKCFHSPLRPKADPENPSRQRLWNSHGWKSAKATSSSRQCRSREPGPVCAGAVAGRVWVPSRDRGSLHAKNQRPLPRRHRSLDLPFLPRNQRHPQPHWPRTKFSRPDREIRWAFIGSIWRRPTARHHCPMGCTAPPFPTA